MYYQQTDKQQLRREGSDFESIVANRYAYEPLRSAVAIVDITGSFIYANPAFDTFNQNINKNIEECYNSETLFECPEIQSWLQEALRSGLPTLLRSMFYYGPKMPVELSICLTPLKGQENDLRGALLTLGEESIEFNRRHLAQLQLKNRNQSDRIMTLEQEKVNSQRLLSGLLHDAPVAMALINERMEIVHINRAASSLLKIDNAKICGQYCDDVLPYGDVSKISSSMSSGLSGAVEEITITSNDGETLTLLRTISTLHAEDDQVMAVVAFLDITEMKSAEVEYHSILQTALDGFWVVKTNGFLQEVNDAYCLMSGYSREELLNMRISDLEVKEDASEIKKRIERLMKDGSDRFVSQHRRKDGRLFDVDISVQYLSIRNGMFVVFIKDITEQKHYEIELKKAKNEAEDANKAKSTFLSNMSHELRTPLNAILGFAQILQAEGLSEESKDEVNYIYKSGMHLLTLINEVLDLSKVEAGKMEMKPEVLNIHDLFLECLNIIAPLAVGANIHLDMQIEQPELCVMVNRDRMVQVILNLMSNAIKYNQSDGVVSISASCIHNNQVKIAITDTGVGISATDLKKVFVPFARVGRKSVEGTGIGLTISKQLVQLMGGQIGVESEEGKGSVFWIELPLHTPELKPAMVELQEEQGDTSIQPAMNEAILYIEDNNLNLRLVERALSRAGFKNLLTAVDGLSGVRMAANQLPALILLDINLPDMSGYDVLRKLRSDTATADIPIIAVTANAMPDDIEGSKSVGFDDYLTKPLNLHILISAVSRFLPISET